MAYLQHNDKRISLQAGDTTIGSGAGVDASLEGAEGAGVFATITVASAGTSIRRAASAAVKVNGIALGAEPSPLIHGDRVEVGGVQLRYGEDAQGGSTQYFSGAAMAEMARQRKTSAAGGAPTKSTGGRLVSLVDGREYAIPEPGLVIGRDAGCDVVVPSQEVSRQHAEIMSGPDGYYVIDTSTNGLFVNARRVEGTQTLGRADVLRIGPEEFRFYADKAEEAPAVAAPAGAGVAAPVPEPVAVAAAPSPVAPAVAPAAQAVAAPVAAPASPAGSAPAPAAAPVASPASLDLFLPAGARTVTLDRSPMQFGRGEGNDVVVSDDSVSEVHGRFVYRDDAWYVIDLDSTNGTYVGVDRVSGERRITGLVEMRLGAVRARLAPGGIMASRGSTARIEQPDAAAPIAPSASATPAASAAKPAPAVPKPAAPASSGGGTKIAIIVAILALVAVAAFFLLQSR